MEKKLQIQEQEYCEEKIQKSQLYATLEPVLMHIELLNQDTEYLQYY